MDWPVSAEDGWVEIASPEGMILCFQQVDDYSAPQWPGQGHPFCLCLS